MFLIFAGESNIDCLNWIPYNNDDNNSYDKIMSLGLHLAFLFCFEKYLTAEGLSMINIAAKMLEEV